VRNPQLLAADFLLAVLWGPVILTLAVFGIRQVGLLTVIGLMAAGYLVWTLTEYWVHRAVFHLEPRGPCSEAFVWAVHGVHQAHPNDPRRVVTTPLASIPIGLTSAPRQITCARSRSATVAEVAGQHLYRSCGPPGARTQNLQIFGPSFWLFVDSADYLRLS